MNKPSNNNFIIGTRGSLLALTQCRQVKKELEEKTGASFDLKIIKTQGDLDTSKPLWQMEGKDFFTKELDEELMSGKVDLVVHSYKDLGSIRPKGIELCSITKRQFSNDVLFMRKDVTKNLNHVSSVEIGTSSPRRIFNIEQSLSEFLPHNPEVKTKQLRGNVNTRLKKCVDGQYDGVVLAFAGVERLCMDENSAKEIAPMLEKLEIMILPQSTFPSAASQGALAIEIRSNRNDNGNLRKILNTTHCENTKEAVSIERKLFNTYGGGCHLAISINATKVSGFLKTSLKGTIDGQKVNKLFLQTNIKKPDLENLTNSEVFIGVSSSKEGFIFDKLTPKKSLKSNFIESKINYITSSYVQMENKAKHILFCSGTRTWKKHARSGHWFVGSSDSCGDQILQSYKKSSLLRLKYPQIDEDWVVHTHPEGTSALGKISSAYEREKLEPSIDFVSKIKKVKIFFWTSLPQYQAYLKEFPFIEKAIHCCGIGKTYKKSLENNLNFIPFSGMNEFKSWINEENKKV